MDVRCKKWLVNLEGGNRTDQTPEGGSTGAGVPLSSVLPPPPPPPCGGRVEAAAAELTAPPAASLWTEEASTVCSSGVYLGGRIRRDIDR